MICAVSLSLRAAADNGGQRSAGASNAPLRGNKATLFEAGVRGVAFVAGGTNAIPPPLRACPAARTRTRITMLQGTISSSLMHAVDWMPTLAALAGAQIDFVSIFLSSTELTFPQPVDGIDQSDALFGSLAPARTEVLLQLDPPDVFWGHFAFDGQAAIRVGDWKLIAGVVRLATDARHVVIAHQPNCSLARASSVLHDYCPIGWLSPAGDIAAPPQDYDLLWLFNVRDDPTEQHDLSHKYPELVRLFRPAVCSARHGRLRSCWPASRCTMRRGCRRWCPASIRGMSYN